MLNFLTALTVVAGAGSALAAPVGAPAGGDTTILQYALTLEHLEDTFYRDALSQFDQAAFEAAGYPDWVRNRFMDISGDEASHVAFLTGALGANAVAACTYKFPYTDVTSFIGFSSIVENVGVSAYLGAAADISLAAYLTAAGSILTTEARHQGWVQAAVQKQNFVSSPYDTPLGFDTVYSVAAAVITACPSSNPSLPFMAYPALTASSTVPGTTVQLTYTDKTMTEKYLIVFYGLTTVACPINSDMTVTLPTGLLGTSYAVVSSSSNTTSFDPSTVIAGPLILLNPFNSQTTDPNPANAGAGMAT